jgi:hypothetical protein
MNVRIVGESMIDELLQLIILGEFVGICIGIVLLIAKRISTPRIRTLKAEVWECDYEVTFPSYI